MDSRLELGKRVEWDDWIGRFIGYLGEFEYIHGNDEVDINYTWDTLPKADNIVYIYGAEKGGRRTYVELLSEELNHRKDCVCYGFSFEQMDAGKKLLDFQELLAESFRQGDSIFQFPCLNLLAAAEMKHEEDGMKELLSNLLDVSGTLAGSVETLTTGSKMQKILACRDLLSELKKSKDFLKNMMHGGVEADAVKELKARLKTLATRKSGVSVVSVKNPFDCLQMDLQINVKSIRKRAVCTIDAFELSENRFADAESRAHFLRAMASVPGIVWVLFSSKMPDDDVRHVVKRENFWRMGGISEQRTLRYLERECTNSQTATWKRAVYYHTGGMLGLLNLCVNARNEEDKAAINPAVMSAVQQAMQAMQSAGTIKSEDAEKIGKALVEQFSQQMKLMPDTKQRDEEEARFGANVMGKAEKSESREERMRRELEQWFEKVWNGSGDGEVNLYSESERERKDPLDFLFGSGRIDFEEITDDDKDVAKKYFLPCLCYLIQRSLLNVGKFGQYSWERKKRVLELSDLGNRCLRMVERDPLFCREYEEYPNVIYLDPVIVRVISKHRNYEKWLNAFRDNCVVEMEPVGDKEILRKSTDVLTIFDAEGKLHNYVKVEDSTVLDKNAGIVHTNVHSMLERQAIFSKNDHDKSMTEQPVTEQPEGHISVGTGESQMPELPREENAVEKSYREGNEEDDTGSAGKSDADKKQMEGMERILEEKEFISTGDNNNPMGKS